MPIRVDAYLSGGIASGHVRACRATARHPRDRRASCRSRARRGRRSTTPRPVRPATSVIASRRRPHRGRRRRPVHRRPRRRGTASTSRSGRTRSGRPADPARLRPGPRADASGGEFVMLRDVRLSGSSPSRDGHRVATTRSSTATRVERVTAELMLGFFFPGAAIEDPPGRPGTAGDRPPSDLGGRSRPGPSADRLAMRVMLGADPGVAGAHRDGRGSASRSGTKPSSTVHGIARLSRRWTPRSRSASSMQTSEIASPVAPARPVRPIRWM